MSVLTWELVDLNQDVLSRLDNRKPGGVITIPNNDERRAEVTISLEDEALEAISAQECVLRVTHALWDNPCFIGRVVVPEGGAGEGEGGVKLQARDPMQMLEKAFIRDIYTATTPDVLLFHQFHGDQSAIMADVCAYGAGNGHGIVTGDLAVASVTRTLTYPLGHDLASILREIAAMDTGPDFELEPFVTNSGSLCRINTFYPKRGESLVDTIRLEHGFGRENVPGYNRSPAGDQLCNFFVAIGQGTAENPDIRPAYVAQHDDSITTFGRFERFEEVTDATNASTLAAHAKGHVAQFAYPPDFFTFSQSVDEGKPVGERDFGDPPLFGPDDDHDYYLGDTVMFNAKIPGKDSYVEGVGRIAAASITEQPTGAIVVAVEISPELDAAGVTGAEYIGWLPNLEPV